MTDLIIPRMTAMPAGEIAAVGVSIEEYMERYAAEHYEWVDGVVVKMSPINARHDDLAGYFYQMLKAYLALNPIAVLRREPFVMKVDATKSGREPDLQLILDANLDKLSDTAMLGAADLRIEDVSPESVARDYGEKFVEYVQGGVQEYWIIDPLREDNRFCRLSAHGVYTLHFPDEAGNYQTPLLPRLKLHVPTLWQRELPDFFQVAQMVQAMFADG